MNDASRLEAQQIYFEDDVKAAFLYHFGTYVEWPDDHDVVTITVLGAETIAERLEIFLQGRTISGKPVDVRQIENISELIDEQILFLGAAENARLDALLEEVGTPPVLIVTDSPSGLPNGAIINLRVVDNRVRFEISLPAAERAGLTLSSRLLSAALRVESAD
jgi:hypothetical protein